MDSNGYNESLFYTGRCFNCGCGDQLVRHEVFHGNNRERSKRYGCWVTLCVRCHQDLHNHPASYRWMQKETQRTAMERYGWTLEDFRKIFGKSYL